MTGNSATMPKTHTHTALSYTALQVPRVRGPVNNRTTARGFQRQLAARRQDGERDHDSRADVSGAREPVCTEWRRLPVG